MTDTNPYRAPSADVADVSDVPTTGALELAGRGHRFGAAMVDGLLESLIIFPLGYATGLIDFSSSQDETLISSILMALMGFAVFALLQSYFLARNGQSIGKKLVGIRIVNLENKLPGLGRLLGFRAGSGYLFSAVPVIGGLFSLVDILFIFRNDRRCIHDLIAGTKVVTHNPKYSSITWFVLPFVFMFVLGIGAAIAVPRFMHSGVKTLEGPTAQRAPANPEPAAPAKGGDIPDSGAGDSGNAGTANSGALDSSVLGAGAGAAPPAPAAAASALGTAAPQAPQRAASDLRKCADLKDPAAIIRCSQSGK